MAGPGLPVSDNVGDAAHSGAVDAAHPTADKVGNRDELVGHVPVRRRQAPAHLRGFATSGRAAIGCTGSRCPCTIFCHFGVHFVGVLSHFQYAHFQYAHFQYEGNGPQDAPREGVISITRSARCVAPLIWA
jgi:hypothetical protein